MTRGGVIVALGALALAGFLYVQPFLTIRVLAGALQDSDAAAIRERMEAERVREGLKAQFLSRQPPDLREHRGVAANVAALALFGRGIELILATRAAGEGTPDSRAPATIIDSGFDGFSRFHATVEQPGMAPFTMVLEREADGWSVTAMHPSERAWRELEELEGQAAPSKLE